MLIRIIVHRILWAVPLLLGMSFISFVLIRLVPGSYFQSLRLNPQISEDTIRELETKYHLDKPIVEQYFFWLINLLRGDLGYSFYYHAPVGKVLLSRIGPTLLLSSIALVLVWIVVIPAGVYSQRFNWADPVLSAMAFVFMCLPSFLLAFLFLFFALTTGLLPLGGMHSLVYQDLPWHLRILDMARHLLIPSLVISLPAIGALFRVVRANLRTVLTAPFILNARAKGFGKSYILWHHALPNSIHPLIVIFGYQLSDILSGAALVEIICNWPGMGSLMLSAVQAQDLYLVMAGMMVGGVMLILGNVISDIILYCLDPRIREGVM